MLVHAVLDCRAVSWHAAPALRGLAQQSCTTFHTRLRWSDRQSFRVCSTATTTQSHDSQLQASKPLIVLVGWLGARKKHVDK